MVQTIQNNIEPDYRLASDKFCYWLQGFFEMTEATTMTQSQVKMVKDHLNMVFTRKIAVPDPLPQFQGYQPDVGVNGGIIGSNTGHILNGMTTIC